MIYCCATPAPKGEEILKMRSVITARGRRGEGPWKDSVFNDRKSASIGSRQEV